VGSSARENGPWSDKYAGYVSEELSLPETSMIYFFEEPVRSMPEVDAPRRFDVMISCSKLGDFAEGPTRSTRWS
jgi:hypothetical protein